MKKHIYIYSPSGAVRDKAAFRRGVARLTALGHEVEIDPDALTSWQRFAGDDATRLAAVHRAAASGADVALVSRGGYGMTRLLPDLRYKAIGRAIERGMLLIGISDFTALQCAVLAKTGNITWAGPALCEGFGVGGKSRGQALGKSTVPLVPDEIMEACFDDLLCGQGEGAGWRQRAASSGTASKLGLARPSEQLLEVKNATLWGGNLSVLTSLVGTPYFPDVRGGVLFLEDVGEHPYRIERMLTHLLHSGVLARQKAVVMGQFNGFKLTPHDRGFNLNRVWEWLRGKVKVPVLTNLPYGHVPTKVLLPVGGKVDLVTESGDAMLFWGHAH